MNKIKKAYYRNTIFTSDQDGYCISCAKGSWSVYGPDKKAVIKDAKNLFNKYYQSGAYDA